MGNALRADFGIHTGVNHSPPQRQYLVHHNGSNAFERR
jgi:hypothetical protein